MSNNQLNDISKTYLEAVYGGNKKEAPKDDRLVVTNADKKANTKAYQNYKSGNKAYKAADHLKDDYEFSRHKASIISRGGRLEDAVESWNQKLAYREAMKDVREQKKEVDVKDTYKTVAAIVDYDRSKKGSKDATYDSMKGDKKAAKKERDYAAFEREKMKKDDPNWKSKKYHTGMHGEEKMYGYSGGGLVKKKKKKHDCASKVKHEEYGIGNCIKGMHDLDENGVVQHYDVFFEHGIEKNVPVSSLEILEGSMHEHVIYTEQKKAAKDYDGDGKIESGKDEYFGSRDKAIKKAMAKRVKKESLSDWRDDLSDLIEIVAEPEEKAEKKVKEGKVNNKVVINPKISEAIQEMGGEVLEHHQVDCDDDCEPNCEHDVAEQKVKKEIKALSTAARTMKGRSVAKADAIEEGHGKKNGKKNCGCGQDPCITYGEQKEGSRLKKSQVEESEKLAQKAYDRAQKLGAKRRAKQGVNRGVGKSERAGYNLAQAQRSRNTDAATQGGPQTGGGSKSFGYAKNKSNPVKSKRTGDTGALGHYKKRDEKTSVGKKGGKLKTPKYKLSSGERLDHHSTQRDNLKDPKKNPKHTANVKSESVQSALDSLNTYYTKNEKLHGSIVQKEDAALDFVKKKIEREHGKGAYVSKDNPRKPQSAAEKAKVAAHKAKLAKQDHRDPTEKASDGRYSDRYSNRGSD